MAIYKPLKNLPVSSRKGQKCPSGRPPDRPGHGHFSDRCASGRPLGRPGQAWRSTSRTRELGAFSRSTARSTDLQGWPMHDPRAHRSTGSIDRQLNLAEILELET